MINSVGKLGEDVSINFFAPFKTKCFLSISFSTRNKSCGVLEGERPVVLVKKKDFKKTQLKVTVYFDRENFTVKLSLVLISIKIEIFRIEYFL